MKKMLIICTVLIFAVGSTSAQITVGPGGPPNYDHATIQAAIDVASSGDVITVAAGVYAGNITVNESLTILGDPGDDLPGPGSNAPIIDGGSLPGSAFFIANGVTNVTIKGFEMRNFTSNDTGIGNGISAWQASTSYITIQDNYFHHLGYNGVLVGNDGAAGDHTNWLIKGNIIEEFYYIGFELTNTSNSSIEDNIIHMNTPYIGAIFISARRSETDLTIKNNLIDGTPSAIFPVIYIYAYDLDMPSPNLDNVMIEGNTIKSKGIPYQIYIRDVGAGTVTGVQAHYNNLSTFKNLTSVQIDATCNWWGHYTGPSSIDAISGDVVFDPWLVLPEGLESGIERATIEFKKKANDDKVHIKGVLGESGVPNVSDNCSLPVPSVDKEVQLRLRVRDGGTPIDFNIFLEEKGKNGEKWEYKRPKGDTGPVKHMKIDWKNGKFDIHIDKADLSVLKSYTGGDFVIRLRFDDINFSRNFIILTEKKHGKWEYKKPKGGLGKYNTTTASEKAVTTTTETFSLSENYPNPFNPTTLISYNLSEASQVTMTVYDLMGRKVKTLIQGFQPAGNHSVLWNATNDNGDLMSGGMYFYQIKTGSFQKTHKMILLK